MSNDTTQHTPAEVREPTDAQINVWSIIRSALSRAWALSRPWAVADRPQVTSEVVARLDAIAADCEREVLALLRTPRGEGEAMDADAMWYHWTSGHEDAALQGLRAATDDEARRLLSMLADWQRCPMPSDHDAAAALLSEAQAEVWHEVDDLLARLERFEYDAAGESEEYWRVVAMRDRISAARRGEGGGE